MDEPPPPHDLPAKFFRFDDGFDSTGGLNFVFSRDAATFGRKGKAVMPGVPRYEQATLIASAPIFQHLRSTPWPVTILGGGVDHDGLTPLMIVEESHITQTLLDVFSATGDAFKVAEYTSQGRTRTILGGDPDPDLMLGTVPGKQYRPEAAVVCHGLIVVYCTVRVRLDERWQDAAGAFVTSQDRGLTWTLAFESEPFAVGSARGALWCMQNWWPAARGVAPLEAFFVATDYCHNGGSPGASMFVMRASRPAVSEPWSIDDQGGATVLHTVFPGQHSHTGGIFPMGDSGLWAFTVLGDLRGTNRIVSMRRPDRAYSNPDWEIRDDFHGAGGDPGLEANQFVGCAPGPTEGTVIAGADLSAEQLMLLRLDPASPNHPSTSHLYGLPPSHSFGATSFIVRTPFPERGGPYAASSGIAYPIPNPLIPRTLFSPDGLNWCQAAQSAGYPFIHGDDIYFAGLGVGITRTPLPWTSLQRPLLVGPGGLQRTRALPDFDAPGGEVTPLARNAAGYWIDGDLVLSPQPPSASAVYRVQSHHSEAPYLVAWVYPAGSGPFHRTIPGDDFQCRWWVLNPDPSRSSVLYLSVGSPCDPWQAARQSLTACTDRWFPVDVAGYMHADPGEPIGLRIIEGPVGEDQTVYLALDNMTEGAGAPGYAMPCDTSPGQTGQQRPDELAAVTGLACSSRWTVTFAAQIPEDGFDASIPTQHRWPIATLWGTDNDRIEFIADTLRGRFSAEVYSHGVRASTLSTGPMVWLRGSEVLVSAAQQPGFGPIEVTASVCGGAPVRLNTISPSPAHLRPRELRFYSSSAPPSASGMGDRVSPLTVFGGRIDPAEFLSNDQRQNLLTSLNFLRR